MQRSSSTASLPKAADASRRQASSAASKSPATAAAGNRLDHHRVADAPGLGRQPAGILVFAKVTGRHGHAVRQHQPLRGVLAAHRADRRRRGTDPHQSCRLYGRGEVRVFRQEAIPGMHGSRAGRAGCVEDPGDVEVALGRRRAADVHGHICPAYEQRMPVDLRMYGDRAYAQTARRTLDPQRDLAPVRDEHRFQHGLHPEQR
jgi:hypothetical protein